MFLDKLAEEVLVRSEDAGTTDPREARFAIALEVFSMATRAMDRRLALDRDAAVLSAVVVSVEVATAAAVVVAVGDLAST